MSQPTPTITVAVDVTNPGQFFACCGLLELADRLWPGGAEGWFTGSEFHLTPVDAEARQVATAELFLKQLATCPVSNTMTEAQWKRFHELTAMGKRAVDANASLKAEKEELDSLRRESPIRLGRPFDLLIDWFHDDTAGGSRFKTWAGQQSVFTIATGMLQPLQAGRWNTTAPASWLGQPDPAEGLPFNFDSDLSGHGAAIDAGFSFDPLGIGMPSRPLIELMGFVGLQRFRPATVEGHNLYRYQLWPIPLPPTVAAAVGTTVVTLPGGRLYEFSLLYRTKYLKSFLPAKPFRGDAR